MKIKNKRRQDDQKKSSWVWISSMLLLVFVFTLGSSCGMTSGSNQNLVDDDDDNDNNNAPIITFPSDGPGEPLPFSFSITGSLGDDPEDDFTVQTDSVLRLRLTPGPGSQVTVPGIQYTAVYGCVQYSVTVNGRTEDTPILKVAGQSNIYCPNAPTSALMDFSDRLGGPEDPVITVSHARYDFYCKLWYLGLIGGGYNLYCPIRAAYKTHVLTGNLSVQINGTQAP